MLARRFWLPGVSRTRDACQHVYPEVQCVFGSTQRKVSHLGVFPDNRGAIWNRYRPIIMNQSGFRSRQNVGHSFPPSDSTRNSLVQKRYSTTLTQQAEAHVVRPIEKKRVS